MMSGTRTQHWLSRASPAVFGAWAMGAAFATYFCMYGFRRPFAVGTFEGTVLLPWLPPVDLKTLFIVSQVLGYASSKFLGIKVVSEMPARRRAAAILSFISVAELALLAFALIPTPYNAIALVLNGLALGMIWGLVFSFLEGRRTTDLLGAGLCASFIVASGFVKMVGRLLMDPELGDVSEAWMPFVTGLVFFPPLLLFLWMLAQLPGPTAEDEKARTPRVPMDGTARRAFFRVSAPGIVTLIFGYVLLSAYRDFRDNFARELWDALGYSNSPAVFTTAEIPIALITLVAIAAVVRVRDNRKALSVMHGLMIAGALLTGASTLLYQLELLPAAAWMICVGLGLYLGYVPVNCVIFDRLVAAGGRAATAAFLIYVADASGYVGSVVLLLYKSFGHPTMSWLDFFVGASHAMALGCSALFAISGLWFWRATRPPDPI